MHAPAHLVLMLLTLPALAVGVYLLVLTLCSGRLHASASHPAETTPRRRNVSLRAVRLRSERTRNQM